MDILEWLWRATSESEALHKYQHFPFPVRVTSGLIPTSLNKRSSPMQFTINRVEYRLAFQHSPLKRQPPSRFDSIPSGLTTCTIYRRAKGEGKPKWYIRHIATVAQFGGYHRDKGRKAALAAVLEEAGWSKELRTTAWEAYHLRNKKAPREVPGVSTVRAAA